MKKISMIIITLMLCMTLKAEAQTNDSNQKQVLSYSNYITIISQKLPAIKRNRIALEKSQNALYTAKGIDDVTITASGTYYKNREYSTDATSTIDETKRYTFSGGVQKVMSQTGTRLSATYQLDKTTAEGNITGTGPFTSDTYLPRVTFTVTQPLLYNFFGKLDRYAYHNAEMQLEIDKINKQLNDSATLNYYKKLYIYWVQYESILQLMKKSIDNSKKLDAQVIRKFRKRLADNDDVQKARSSTLQYQALYKEYEKVFKSIEKELSLYIDLDTYKPGTDEFIRLFNEALGNTFPLTDFEKTRGHSVLIKTLARLQYSLDINNNKLLPSLDLIGSITQKDNSETYTASPSPDRDYYVGLSFTYKLGNHEKKGAVNETKLLIKDLRNEYSEAKDNYRKSLNNLLVSSKSYKEVLTIRNKKIKALKSQYRTETLKYSQARLNLSYLIQTQNDIASEEITILDLQVKLIETFLDYTDTIY